MVPRHMIHWRIYVYANGLYSLPDLTTRGFREWSPQYFSRNPFELHRVMDFVNRDVSILLRANKSAVLNVYETVLSLLPRVGIKSSEFLSAMSSYFGAKTKHFIHELINFARSPYDDLISYECSVQYKFRSEDDDGPSTAAAARERQRLACGPGLLNFVVFSRRINPDDCGGFEAELMLEDEDAGELDEMVIEHFNRPLVLELRRNLDGDMSPAGAATQSAGSHPAGILSPVLDFPLTSQQQQQPQPQPQPQQPATQQPPQPQQQQQQLQQPPQSIPLAQPAPLTLQAAIHAAVQGPGQPPSNPAPRVGIVHSVPVNDLELEMAIERSLYDTGASSRVDPYLPGGRALMVANPHLSRSVSIGGGGVPLNPLTSAGGAANPSVLVQNILATAAGQRNRRRRHAGMRVRRQPN
ncbi:hypothetical protein KR067_010754 [Drosophila pandora]|nr:hypothetical protein KR067_010754 [Drosophila pandora]